MNWSNEVKDIYTNNSKYCNKMQKTLDDWKTSHVHHRNRKTIINCILKHKSSQAAKMFQAKWVMLLLLQYFAPCSTEKVSEKKKPASYWQKTHTSGIGTGFLNVFIVIRSPIFLCKDIKTYKNIHWWREPFQQWLLGKLENNNKKNGTRTLSLMLFKTEL